MWSRSIRWAGALAAAIGVLASCSSDGRTLRPPRADQNQSILVADSTTTQPPALSGASSDADLPAVPDEALSGMGMRVAWADGGDIPLVHGCAGAGTSPAVRWFNLPAGTVEVAITMIDTDVGGAVHWIIVGLKPLPSSIEAGAVPPGAAQANNLQDKASYSGPCPPAGTAHRYLMQVWALKAPSGIVPGATAATALTALERNRLSSAAVLGTYRR